MNAEKLELDWAWWDVATGGRSALRAFAVTCGRRFRQFGISDQVELNYSAERFCEWSGYDLRVNEARREMSAASSIMSATFLGLESLYLINLLPLS